MYEESLHMDVGLFSNPILSVLIKRLVSIQYDTLVTANYVPRS